MLKILRCCNGVQMQALYFTHHFRPLSSTRDVNPSLANYLVDSLGFSSKQSVCTSTKLALFWNSAERVIDFNFAENANSVINFFNQHGFDNSQIRKIVCYDPRILTAKVDKTLEPKFKILKELGLSGHELTHAILANPAMLTQRLNLAIQALRAVLDTDEMVVILLRRSKWVSLSSVSKYLVSNAALLKNEWGISTDRIQKAIVKDPRPFLQRADMFEDTLVRVEQKFGIPRHSGMFLYGMHTVTSLSEKTIESKCQVFMSFGWARSDVMAMIRKGPPTLMCSAAKLEKNLDFLMNELGYSPAFLASCPALLSYSLEKRLVPRHLVFSLLKEKGLLSCRFSTAAILSESKFLMQFVQQFKDVVPDLLQVYCNSKDCPVVDSRRGC